MPPELLIEIVRKHGLGPNQLQVEDSEITCSIGVCVAPEGGACCQDAYRNADVALLDAPSDAIVVCAFAGKDKKTCLSQPCYKAIWGNTNRFRLSQQMNPLVEDPQMLLNLLPGGLIRYSARTQEFAFASENTLRVQMA